MPPGFEFSPMSPIEIVIAIAFFGGLTMVAEAVCLLMLRDVMIKTDFGEQNTGCLFFMLACVAMFFGAITFTWVVPNSWYNILGIGADISRYVAWTDSIIALIPILAVISFTIISYRQEHTRRREAMQNE